ncbi:HSPB1-associated protein 1 isoform X2 [Hydra vulgaris]|uniref:HSPB1-associated protein 1 isoform X2 n=1 Tax=Hydra vulgaris TaxID=6087 RepID=A0ABM4CWG8_HYDVU
MIMDAQYIDGSLLSEDQMKAFLYSQKEPVVITNMINDWSLLNWTLDQIANEFGSIETSLKIYKRKYNDLCSIMNTNSNPIVPMETDCLYIKCLLKEFIYWITEKKEMIGKLAAFPYSEYWGYADYNYMFEFFKDFSYVLNEVNWGKFGYPNRNGFHSTIWFGSKGSFTPCHQDAYGTNLVAQILGIKEWILFSPHVSELMQATRIPYEESTIFSKVDVKSYLQYGIKVRLLPGEVLYVPKHWWHYVENETNSISINTWLEMETDSYDRICEALVKILVFSMKKYDGTSPDRWLNPNEEVPKNFSDCLQLLQSALNENYEVKACMSTFHTRAVVDDQHGSLHKLEDIVPDTSTGQDINRKKILNHCDNRGVDCDFLVNCFTDKDVLTKVIEVMLKKMKNN